MKSEYPSTNGPARVAPGRMAALCLVALIAQTIAVAQLPEPAPEPAAPLTAPADSLLGLLLFADDFADASLARTASGTLVGLNLLATLEPGEPRHANKTGGHSLWLTWRAPATGVATFQTVGSALDTLLAVYKGTNVAALTPLVANDDFAGLLSSRVQFNAVAGRDYHIAVDGFSLAVGDVVLDWALSVTTNLLPVITSLTANQAVADGASLTLAVTVEQTPDGYQWFRNGQPVTGATNRTLDLTPVRFANVGSYSVRVTADGQSVLSEDIVVQINEVDGVASRTLFAYDKWGDLKDAVGKVKSLTVAKAGAAHGFSGTQIFSTAGSTKDPGEPNHCGLTGGASEWFAWQSPTNGTAVVTTDGSNFDTVLAIYVGPGDSFSTLTNVACDNDSGSNGKTSRTVFQAQSGVIYWIAVDGLNGASGTVKLNYAVGSAPKILTQPVSRSVALGQSVTFSVTAQGFPIPRYQWSFNGANISSATNSTLSRTNISLPELGLYRVRITNVIGLVWSSPADLLLDPPLHFVAPRIGGDGFYLSIQGPAGTNYLLECSSDLSTWRPVLTNRTLTGTFNFVDAAAVSNRCLFYRVRPVP